MIMKALKNYAEISFSNPILIDIFSHYMKNSVLASFVSDSGKISLTFKVNPPVETPKNCEQVLGLLYALLESNGDTAAGQAYNEHMTDILRETLYRLTLVLDGFTDVRMSIHTTEGADGAEDKEITRHTEFTLSRRTDSV